jgi:hypothetical protein
MRSFTRFARQGTYSYVLVDYEFQPTDDVNVNKSKPRVVALIVKMF